MDQDRARALSRLREDLEWGRGSGGWYYEALTGNIAPNLGRAALSEMESAPREMQTPDRADRDLGERSFRPAS